MPKRNILKGQYIFISIFTWGVPALFIVIQLIVTLFIVTQLIVTLFTVTQLIVTVFIVTQLIVPQVKNNKKNVLAL